MLVIVYSFALFRIEAMHQWADSRHNFEKLVGKQLIHNITNAFADKSVIEFKLYTRVAACIVMAKVYNAEWVLL
jgi:hypothetical protein